MHNAQAMAERDQRCILLFGMPRSGTTWIGKLFDSHPHTLYRHEPDSWRRLTMSRYPAVSDASDSAEELRDFVAGLPRINALRVAGKQPLFPKSYLSGPRLRVMRAAVNLARAGSRLYPEFPVLAYASGEKDPQRRLVWKSIESLGRLGVLLEVMSSVRAIQILRHPCGYIASVSRGIASQSFSYNDSGSEDYGIFQTAIDTSLGQRYRLSVPYLQSLTPEERLAWRWVLINEKAWLESRGSERYMCVRYEDICRDPLGGVAAMFELAGLEMNEQTRRFVENSTGSHRRGYYSVFKDPEVAALRWRDELDAPTIDRVMAIANRSLIGRFYAEDALATGRAP